MNGNRTNLTIPSQPEDEITPAIRVFVEMLLARIDELETRRPERSAALRSCYDELCDTPPNVLCATQ